MTSDTVSINELTIPQLQELSRHMEQKIQFISASIQQLKLLQNQFLASKNCLKDFTKEQEHSDILVPLTATLCVPGKLTDSSKSLLDAENHFNRRVEYINKQIQKIAPLLEEKTKVHKSISEILELKTQEFLKNQSTVSR